MASIHYLPDEKAVAVSDSETILQASLRSGIPHTHVCGGKARCSTCRVIITDGLQHCAPRNARELRLAEKLRFDERIRLACQTTVQGDVAARRLVLDEEDTVLTSQLAQVGTPASVGVEKHVAILFSDIRGFTPFTETLLPYDVIHILRRYFHRMECVIEQHGGYINNTMGDGLLALFGVDEAEGASLRAVGAGLDMLKALERFNDYLDRLHGRRLGIGIGVHYGQVVLGTIRSSGEQHQNVIGDAVNFASRVESANKEAGTHFLISESTYEQVRHEVEAHPCPRTRLKGKSGEHTLYQVIEFTTAGRSEVDR